MTTIFLAAARPLASMTKLLACSLVLLPLLEVVALPAKYDVACPCTPRSLCSPLTAAAAKLPLRGGPPEVLAFARGDNFTSYDMSVTTTIATTLAVPSVRSVCFAHSHGVRVVMLSGEEVDFTNASARAGLVRKLLNQTLAYGLDGINLDIERYSLAPGPLTQYVAELGAALKAQSPPLQLSFDLSISPGGQRAHYDHKALAQHLDYIVPMAYDENWGALTPRANSPISAMAGSVSAYQALGVPAAKLVVALPWYGTSWPCSDGTLGAPCHTALGKRTWAQVVSQPRVSDIVARWKVLSQNTSAVQLDPAGSMSKIFEWVEKAPSSSFVMSDGHDGTAAAARRGSTAAITRHIDMYDDAETIRAKVAALTQAAKAAGGAIGGTAMWYAECIIDDDARTQPSFSASEKQAMWKALVAMN